jgi:hypothetical protein
VTHESSQTHQADFNDTLFLVLELSVAIIRFPELIVYGSIDPMTRLRAHFSDLMVFGIFVRRSSLGSVRKAPCEPLRPAVALGS